MLTQLTVSPVIMDTEVVPMEMIGFIIIKAFTGGM